MPKTASDSGRHHDARLLVRMRIGTDREVVVREFQTQGVSWLSLQLGPIVRPEHHRILVPAESIALPRATFMALLDALLPVLAERGVRAPRIGLEQLAARWRHDVETQGDVFDRAVAHVLRALGALESTRDAGHLAPLAQLAYDVRAQHPPPGARAVDVAWASGEPPIRRSGRGADAARALLDEIRDAQTAMKTGGETLDGLASRVITRLRYLCPTLGRPLGRTDVDVAHDRFVRALETLLDKGVALEALDPEALGRSVLVAHGLPAQDAANFFKWVDRKRTASGTQKRPRKPVARNK